MHLVKQLGVFIIGMHLSCMILAQNVFTLTDEDKVRVPDFEILEDKNYSFEQIVADSTLPFRAVDSFRADQCGQYWVRIKIENPRAYTSQYMVRFFPMVDNTLYYFDHDASKWVHNSNGLVVPSRQRNMWNLPCVLQGQQTNVLYIRSNIETLRGFSYPMVPSVSLIKAAFANEKEQFLWVFTLVTVLLVFMLFCYNAYIYYVFKDRTYLYYLITQIGGILYILSANKYINVLFGPRFCRFMLTPNGSLWDYDLNILVNRLSILLVVVGFIQLTRVYLETGQLQPRLDKVLKILLWAYVLLISISAPIIMSGIAYIDIEVAYTSNVLVVITVFAILYVAVVSYRRRYKAARYFLLANIIPLGVILFLGLFYIQFPALSGSIFSYTANIAVIAQAFCLALALVERFLLIRDELKQKQLEAKELTYQNERIVSENLLHKIQNDLLQEKLEFNQRELASTTLYIYQKNELLSDLKTHIHSLRDSIPTTAKVAIQNIESVIRDNLYLDADWERFRIHFEKVHPNFFKNLREAHPTLTKNEVRLCAYFYLNLSTKEIAGLLNIDPASVRKAKMRLNKKMNIEVLEEEL